MEEQEEKAILFVGFVVLVVVFGFGCFLDVSLPLPQEKEMLLQKTGYLNTGTSRWCH